MIYLFQYSTPSAIPILQRDATPLINELRSFPGWAQCFDRTWLIATFDDIETVAQRLERHLQDSDSSLLLVIGQPHIGYIGRMAPEIWDWIDNSRNMGY